MTVPYTSTRSDHALTIQCEGVIIGHIQEWTPQQSLTVTPVFQIGPTRDGVRSGNVVENVPGNIGGLNISVNRYDLYLERMETIWGPGFYIDMLTDQFKPFTVTEKWQTLTNKVEGTTVIERWQYTGCWFTSLGRTHSAQGDRITKVNASLVYANKINIP